jgi:hypothetical protein
METGSVTGKVLPNSIWDRSIEKLKGTTPPDVEMIEARFSSIQHIPFIV